MNWITLCSCIVMLCVRCDGCMFGINCDWNVSRGFEIVNSKQLKTAVCQQENSCPNIDTLTESALLLQGKNSLHGVIIQEIINANFLTNTICVNVAYHSADARGNINLSVQTGNEESSNNQISIDAQTNAGWQKQAIRQQLPSGQKSNVTIDFSLEGAEGFVVVANISIAGKCEADDDKTECPNSEDFSCEDGTCVNWRNVCDLKEDCPNGNDERVCDILPQSALCTFENGTCGWTNIMHYAGFKWQLQQGPSRRKRTGPDVDHTLKTKAGHYMYIDGGDGNLLSHATLQSVVMPTVHENFADKCQLRFFYHMFGKDVNKLEVSQTELCSNNKVTWHWLREGQQGNDWNFAEVNIEPTLRYVIKFYAYGALINHGDIAVDDISFSPGCFGFAIDGNQLNDTGSTLEHLTVKEFRNDTKRHCDPDLGKAAYIRQCLSTQTPEKTTVYQTLSTKQVHWVTGLGTGVYGMLWPEFAGADDDNMLTSSVGKMVATSSENGTVTSSSMVYTTKQHPEKMSVTLIIASTLAAIVVSVVMGTALLCIAIRRRKANTGTTARLEMVSTASDDNVNVAPVQSSSIDMQLRCAVTELNPNYEFITAKYPEQQLREIPRNKLTLIRLLGQGAFGEVYEGTLKNMCANVKELPVAVKTLPALSMDQAETDFLMEAVIISKFMHKNVVKCLGVCFEEHPRYIILELLEGGDLRTFLRDSRTKGDRACTLSMEELLKLAIDIANGCRHLEEKHFVHRDVAARNCLLTTREPERIAKIADFGMSRDIYSSDYYRKGGKAMLPIKWMPPEAFLDGVFTSKTDTWSYGVLLWEIFTLGYMPYPGQTNSDVMHFVASGGRLDPPDKCPARLSKIMIMCWNSVADIRPSFGEIIDLLDMCLQDEEVLNANVSLCHYQMSDCFKDASTLAKAASITENADDSSGSLSCDTNASAAGFKDHFESQSREPLLLSSPES